MWQHLTNEPNEFAQHFPLDEFCPEVYYTNDASSSNTSSTMDEQEDPDTLATAATTLAEPLFKHVSESQLYQEAHVENIVQRLSQLKTPFLPLTIPANDVRRVICYRCPCIVSLFAAFMAYIRFKETDFHTDFVAFHAGVDPNIERLKLQGNEIVYILRCDASLAFISDVAEHCSCLFIIDHNYLAWKKLWTVGLPHNIRVILNVNTCAAKLAFRHFQPHLPDQILEMLKLIQDYSLFQHQYAASKVFQFKLIRQTGRWDSSQNPFIFEELLSLELDELLRTGSVRFSMLGQRIGKAVAKAFIVDLSKVGSWGECLAVHGNQYCDIRSEIGKRLSRESKRRGMRGIGIFAYFNPALNCPSKIRICFKTVINENISQITEMLRGEGHKTTCECTIEAVDFHQWKV